ncbi:GNAT family N-acetyltransferase [Pararobbsia alpina]|uniref:GNAT family N-acetyltransferase n=1 Tax=Pararobbsia alpina TaxID=621374 RepID=UPI00158340F4|nr:GNAT family N-acetyltransferase [Pararobbsia alpina]
MRRATLEDVGAISDVYLRSRQTIAAYAPLMHSDEEVRQWIAEFLVPSGEVTVALDGDRIAGMSAMSRAYGVVWLDQLYVSPSSFGLGIGSRLLADVIDRALTVVQLYTFVQNTRARAFYERHGFEAIEYGDGKNNEEGCPDVLYRLPYRDACKR